MRIAEPRFILSERGLLFGLLPASPFRPLDKSKGGLVTDKEIQLVVLHELEYEPVVKSTEIGVAVKNGIVTLTGLVDSYAKKYAAELAAKHISDVKAVVNDLQVKLPSSSELTDEEIAQAAVRALESNVVVPSDKIKVSVHQGQINLEGDVAWPFQKLAAEAAVRNLTGVIGVVDLIEIKRQASALDVEDKIEQALRETAELDAHRIHVEMQGGKVILEGSVRSLIEWDEAERAASSTPGVKEVENRLIVEPYEVQ